MELMGFKGQITEDGFPTIRLRGNRLDRVRFFSVMRPAIRRKWETIFGIRLQTNPTRVRKVELGETANVVSIRTATNTFFVDGLAAYSGMV